MATVADYETMARAWSSRDNASELAEMRRVYDEMMQRGIIRDHYYGDRFSDLASGTKAKELTPPVMPPKPEPITPDLAAPSNELAEYDAIAAELDFAPTDLKKDRQERARHSLVGFMLDNGMPIYDTKNVDKFMDGIVAQKNYEAAQARRKSGGRGVLGGDVPVIGWKWAKLSAYKHAIPIDILKRAQAIKAEHPTAEFTVTDYEVVNPDPFISVTVDGCARIVFGVWDEPGFKAIGRDAKPAGGGQ
jgi:hypothetical protein